MKITTVKDMYDLLEKLIEEDSAEMPLFFATYSLAKDGEEEVLTRKYHTYSGNLWEDVTHQRIVIELEKED